MISVRGSASTSVLPAILLDAFAHQWPPSALAPIHFSLNAYCNSAFLIRIFCIPHLHQTPQDIPNLTDVSNAEDVGDL